MLPTFDKYYGRKNLSFVGRKKTRIDFLAENRRHYWASAKQSMSSRCIDKWTKKINNWFASVKEKDINKNVFKQVQWAGVLKKQYAFMSTRCVWGAFLLPMVAPSLPAVAIWSKIWKWSYFKVSIRLRLFCAVIWEQQMESDHQFSSKAPNLYHNSSASCHGGNLVRSNL